MRFQKVIALNPPSPPNYVSNKDSMSGFGQLFPKGSTYFPTLDLVYLVSFLADKGVDLDVVECLGLELDQAALLQRIEKQYRALDPSQPVLLIARTSAPTLDWDLAILNEIKRRAPLLQIALYGPVVPHVLPRVQRENVLDYIMGAEPDSTVEELVEGKPENGIAGLSYKQDGRWVTNTGRPLLRELDRLPMPKWELFPYRQYTLPRSSTRQDIRFLPMWTSRGCPINCTYCPYPVGQGTAWRYRSAENVVDEIEHLVKDLGVRYIIFRDPMFSLLQKRVIALCDEIVRRGLKVEWRCETRLDFLKQETLQAMARAGCSGINFGIESSDVEIQKGVGRRPIEKEEIVKAISLCHQLGIKTFGFFIVGLPGDTVATALRSIKFALDIKLNWVQFTAASPFIGTKLRDWGIERGLVVDSEYAYVNCHDALMGNENLTKEQVRSLLHLAQFFQNYLINRKGILKDDGRRDFGYRAAKWAADLACDVIAHVIFAFASLRYRKNLHQIPATAKISQVTLRSPERAD